MKLGVCKIIIVYIQPLQGWNTIPSLPRVSPGAIDIQPLRGYVSAVAGARRTFGISDQKIQAQHLQRRKMLTLFNCDANNGKAYGQINPEGVEYG